MKRAPLAVIFLCGAIIMAAAYSAPSDVGSLHKQVIYNCKAEFSHSVAIHLVPDFGYVVIGPALHEPIDQLAKLYFAFPDPVNSGTVGYSKAVTPAIRGPPAVIASTT